MEPKEFVKIKKEIEEQLGFYEDIQLENYTEENKKRLQKQLEKTYLDKLGQITTPPTFIDNDLSFDDIYLDDCSGLEEIDIDYGI